MTKSCKVVSSVNVNKIRAKLQSDFSLPKNVAEKLNSETLQSSYRRCKDANSFPPMKMVKNGPYMYYIDSKCTLTVGNYEKLLQRGSYVEDIRRIANKLGIYDGETKKELIRSNIFEFLKMSGIAEPIRIKVSKTSSVGEDRASTNNSNRVSINNSAYTPSSSTNNRSSSTTNNSAYTPSSTTTNNSAYTPSSTTNNSAYTPPSSTNNRPNFKPEYVKNRSYEGYSSTVPTRPRLRTLRNDKFDFGNMFRSKKKNINFNFLSNDENTKLMKEIQAKYKQNGVTDEYLFEYFKGRPHYDQINLNRFMNKYIPLSMRKKKKILPTPGPTPRPTPGPTPGPTPNKKPNVTNLLVKLQEIKSQI